MILTFPSGATISIDDEAAQQAIASHLVDGTIAVSRLKEIVLRYCTDHSPLTAELIRCRGGNVKVS